jgi:hypothetical protein
LSLLCLLNFGQSCREEHWIGQMFSWGGGIIQKTEKTNVDPPENGIEDEKTLTGYNNRWLMNGPLWTGKQ